jgi:hypothetical protein
LSPGLKESVGTRFASSLQNLNSIFGPHDETKTIAPNILNLFGHLSSFNKSDFPAYGNHRIEAIRQKYQADGS